MTKKKFCLSLHYNGVNSVKGTEIHKAKDSEIVAAPLCLGKLSRDWSVDNLKKNRIKQLFMILVVILMLLQFMIFYTFISI